MKKQKTDRRIKMTKLFLKQALITLLKEKRISKITVKEICHLADVNRSTFYAHYADLYELLDEFENDIIGEMGLFLQSYETERDKNAINNITEKLIEFIGSKHEHCEILLNEQSGSAFEQKIRDVANQFLINEWQNIPIRDQALVDYVSAFIVSGSIQVVKTWLNNGRSKSPREIALLITDLINKGSPFNITH